MIGIGRGVSDGLCVSAGGMQRVHRGESGAVCRVGARGAGGGRRAVVAICIKIDELRI